MDLTTLVILVVSFGCAFLAFGAAVYIGRSRPIALEKRSKALADTVSANSGDVAALRTEWQTYQRAIEGYLSEINETLDSVEHKRRRIAASASKINAGSTVDDNSQESLLARARAAGNPV